MARGDERPDSAVDLQVDFDGPVTNTDTGL
jgi:predicted nucleotidyltransferase